MDDENWYSRTIQMKENGSNTVFSSKFINVCKDCIKKDPREWNKCTHVKSKIIKPDFKSEEAKNKWDRIYAYNGKLEDTLRENHAIITTNKISAFAGETVEYVFDKKNWMDIEIKSNGIKNADYLIMCIDPNRGGNNETAIIIGYKNKINHEIKICWVSRFRSPNMLELSKFVRQNIIDFRNRFLSLKTFPIHIITETDGSYDGDIVKASVGKGEYKLSDQVIQNLENVYVYSENEKRGRWNGKSGILKHGKTSGYVLRTNVWLMYAKLGIIKEVGTTVMDQGEGDIFGSSGVNEEMVGMDNGKDNYIKGDIALNEVLNELKTQLLRFSYNPGDNVYSGKNKGNDDIAVVLLMLVYFSIQMDDGAIEILQRKIDYIKKYY